MTTDNKTDLKPCPFCGRSNPSVDKLRTGAVVVTCGCKASIVARKGENHIDLWNTRTPTAADKLAEALENMIILSSELNNQTRHYSKGLNDCDVYNKARAALADYRAGKKG